MSNPLHAFRGIHPADAQHLASLADRPLANEDGYALGVPQGYAGELTGATAAECRALIGGSSAAFALIRCAAVAPHTPPAVAEAALVRANPAWRELNAQLYTELQEWISDTFEVPGAPT